MTALGGRFDDGRGGNIRMVTVKVTASGLHIRGTDGLMVAFWRTADLCTDSPPGTNGVRLRCVADDGARLEIADAAALRPVLPLPPRRPHGGKRGPVAIVLIGLAVVLWLGLGPLARMLAPLVPPAWEQRWGDYLAQDLERNWRPCRQPAGDAALRLLTDRINTGIDPAWRPRRILVLDQPRTHATTLPGGTVVLPRAVIVNARDADALAAVLAVEFARLRLSQPVAATLSGGTTEDQDWAAAQTARALLAQAGLSGGGALDAERWAALRAICG